MEMTGLVTLAERREARCLKFSLQCLEHPINKEMFPLNQSNIHNVRYREPFTVNFAYTEDYRNSAIPYCQRMLNNFYKDNNLE